MKGGRTFAGIQNGQTAAGSRADIEQSAATFEGLRDGPNDSNDSAAAPQQFPGDGRFFREHEADGAVNAHLIEFARARISLLRR